MRDRYNLNLLPGMSEDGVEYGEPQRTKKRNTNVCDFTYLQLIFVPLCFRRLGAEQRGLHPRHGDPRAAEGSHGAGAEQ